jgi:hypothetical protein
MCLRAKEIDPNAQDDLKTIETALRNFKKS